MTTIAQHIDIIAEDFSTTSTSFTPTDGSLGMVEWDSIKYDPLTKIWFECVFEITYGGSGTGRVDVNLYDEIEGTPVVSGLLFTTITSAGTKRIEGQAEVAAIDLVDGDFYSVRIKVNNAIHTGRLISARIVIIQTGTISKTRIFIPVGYNKATSSMSAIELEGKRWEQRIANFDGTIDAARFHATFRTSNAAATASVRLRNLTSATDEVTLTTTATTYTIVKGTFTYPTANKEYTTQVFISNLTYQCQIKNAHIILDISGGPTKMEIPLLIFGNNDATSTSLVHIEVDGAYHQNRSEEYDGYDLIPYYETVTKGAASTYQVQSQCRANQKVLALTETHTTAYVRKRTATFTDDPINGQILKSTLRVTETGTGTLSVARYIIQANFNIISSLTLPIQILSKIQSEQTMPIEILKKVETEYTLPVQVQEQVIAYPGRIMLDTSLLRPNDVGITTGFSGYPSGLNWDNVDELFEDDDASYNEGGTGNYDFYALDYDSILNDKKVKHIEIYARVKGASAGNLGRMIFALPSQSGAIYEIPHSFLLTDTYQNYSYLVQRNPVSGALWSGADLDDLQIGWKSESTGLSSRLTKIWCIVTYEILY